MDIRKLGSAGLAATAAVALAACTGGGGGGGASSTTASPSKTDKVYSENELRSMISGLKDGDGNELKLYSQDQVAQGKSIGNLLLNTATVDPSDCKSIATAGLKTSVDSGSVAVAISDSQQPRTVSAQSGSDGPDAVQVLKDIEGKMDKCANFSVQVLTNKVSVSSKKLDAKTDATETFGTVSTRDGKNEDMLMQISGAKGRLLVVATKSGSNLADQERKELEGLVNDVLKKADSSSTGSASTSSSSSSGSSSGSNSSSSSSTSSPSTSSSSSSSSSMGGEPGTSSATATSKPSSTSTP
ncbi:hypothetical protein [Sinomonas flava]|uniref:hypothetical protein n=1 Tax=Sinomonas flava TaxID=496857 RepID=UPI0039A513CA